MQLLRISATFTMLSLAAILTGCCGGGTTTKVESSTKIDKSVGDQLLDLKKAYDSGVINEKEYNKLKEDIIKKNSE